jgi:hypothetical protein
MKDQSVSSLIQKRSLLLEQLRHINPHWMRGSLIETYRRCGKPNCYCVNERGHLAHHLSVSHKGNRPAMIYIARKDIEKVKQAIALYHNLWERIEEISEINRTLLQRKTLFEED